VRRVLRVKALAGLFERTLPDSPARAARLDSLGSPEHRELARAAVRKSLVLLKNNRGLLPLNPHARVLVAGDGADDLAQQTGGWTIDWQGNRNTSADFPGATSVYAGIKAAVERGGGTVVLSPDGYFARKPDVAVVVFGERPYAEFEGDRENLAYAQSDPRPLALLKRFQARRIPVVSVLLSGRPLFVNPEINASDAFVAAWLPGSEGAGIADVIIRAADGSIRYGFTGTLSFSWPASAMPVRFAADDRPLDALFTRGYGLNYEQISVLPQLDEAPRIPLEYAGRDVLFHAGHVVRPWSMVVADRASVRLTTTAQVSPGGALEVTMNEGTPRAAWTGNLSGTLSFSGRAIDLRQRAATGGAISLRYRIDQRPTAAVTLGVACGKNCASAIDVTRRFTAAPVGRWVEFSIPLSCFGSADLSRVDTPFALTTDGRFALSFSDIRVSTHSNGASCSL